VVVCDVELLPSIVLLLLSFVAVSTSHPHAEISKVLTCGTYWYKFLLNEGVSYVDQLGGG
jgi:hypothetical protein